VAESSGPEWLRRSVNLILALVALIILLPVMLLIALLVRL
jgi:lipopolysaccharide/colanic/teichoic acid biosynthesis glycosyltransferase